MVEMSSVSRSRPDIAQVDEMQPGVQISRGKDQAVSDPGSREAGADRNLQRDDSSAQVSKLSQKELNSLREKMNVTLEPINVQLNFEQDKESGRTVVTVLNSDTHEVIRQIPPESMLKMARRMEELSGMLIDVWS